MKSDLYILHAPKLLSASVWGSYWSCRRTKDVLQRREATRNQMLLFVWAFNGFTFLLLLLNVEQENQTDSEYPPTWHFVLTLRCYHRERWLHERNYSTHWMLTLLQIFLLTQTCVLSLTATQTPHVHTHRDVIPLNLFTHVHVDVLMHYVRSVCFSDSLAVAYSQ